MGGIMINYSYNEVVDELDEAILTILQQEGRISNVELGNLINPSPRQFMPG